MSARLADFYIIGAMKCATSTLHEQLARRAAFHMSDPKEPNFFNDPQLYPSQMGWYEELFEGASPDQITGESSTHYTKRPTYRGTVENIQKHTPDARFVYVMRDPVDRLISHYIHQWTERNTKGTISESVRTSEEYIAYSMYARQLAPYIETFGKEKILPVFFERLVRNKEEELERVARFLGDTSDEPFQWHDEASQTNVSKDRLRDSAFRDKVLSVDLLRRAKDALPSSLKERIKSVWRMEKRPELDEAAMAYVLRQLEPDVARLGELLGLELTCANFKEVAKRTSPTWSDVEHSDAAE